VVQAIDLATERFQRNTVQNTAIKTLDVYNLPTSRTCLTQLSSVSQDTEHFPHTFVSPTCFMATCTTPVFHKVAVPLKPWFIVTQTITLKQACSMNDTDIGLFLSVARCSCTASFMCNQSDFEFTMHKGNGEALTFQSHESENLYTTYIIETILPV
jgi:hypothetical protein